MVRDFTSEDYTQVIECLQENWILDNPSSKVLSDFLENDNLLCVYEINGKIIGCANLHLQKKLIRNGGIAGFIEEVIIKKDFRGNGYGKEMIYFLLEKAQKIGCYKINLSCYPEKIDFYKKCGFFLEMVTMRKNFQ